MKTFVALMAFACLATSAFASVKPEICTGAPSTKCSAVSTLQISVTQGKCSGTSRASCKTWSQSETVIQEAFEEWWTEGDKLCDGNTITVAAQAVATAVAKVWSSAAVDVSCSDDAQGFACGWSFANGQAFAVSIAEAVATAAADASLALESEGDLEAAGVADAFCYADVRAIGGAFVQAAADAAADACTAGGENPVSVYEDSFAASVQEVIASAFASASARVCASEDGADISSDSECKGEAEVGTEEKLEGDGNFCFGFKQLAACSGVGSDTCCGTGKRRFCRISKKSCPGCNGPWKLIPSPDGNEVWADTKGTQCFCDA